jgi:hypothetical protein
MKAVCLDVMPMPRRDDMGDRIGIIVKRHFGVSGRSGGKIEQHALSGIGFLANELIGSGSHFLIKVEPSLFFAVDEEFCSEGPGFLFRMVDPVLDAASAVATIALTPAASKR